MFTPGGNNLQYMTYQGRVTFLGSNFGQDSDFWVAIYIRSRFLGQYFEQLQDFCGHFLKVQTFQDPISGKFFAWGSSYEIPFKTLLNLFLYILNF